MKKKRAARRPPEANKSTASLAVDTAKDQHIRQLEEDLKETRREYDLLMHKHRQLQLQFQEAMAPKSPPPVPAIVRKPGNLSKTSRLS